MCFSLEVELDIQKLSKLFRSKLNAKEFFYFANKKDSYSKIYKRPSEDGRLYPNYFAPVIIHYNKERNIIPMRYRVRPENSLEEIPSKFNVFNARIDSLFSKKTWKNLVARNHGVVPFKKFYEWVEDENNEKILVSFAPKVSPIENIMWAPCLYDYWIDPETKNYFYSFAVITDDPPPEVLNAGHDRCPIFLKESKIDEWLNLKNTKDVLSLLQNKEETFFQVNKE